MPAIAEKETLQPMHVCMCIACANAYEMNVCREMFFVWLVWGKFYRINV